MSGYRRRSCRNSKPGLQPSGGDEIVERRAGDAGDLRDGALRHPQLEEVTDLVLPAVEARHAQRSFRPAQLLSGRTGFREAFAGSFGDEVAFDFGEQREQGVIGRFVPRITVRRPPPSARLSGGLLRERLVTSPSVRDLVFHRLWRHCARRVTAPRRVCAYADVTGDQQGVIGRFVRRFTVRKERSCGLELRADPGWIDIEGASVGALCRP